MREAAELLTFMRSRYAEELTVLCAAARLNDFAPKLSDTTASYLAADRNTVEQGRLHSLTIINALALGIDNAGLDTGVLANFPGTVASC